MEQLVTVLPRLPGWNVASVFDGPAYDSVNSVFATVGHSFDGTTTSAGNYTTTQSADGYQRVENGEVACQLTATDDRRALRPQVFPLLDALDEYIRDNRTLDGVLSPEGTSDLLVTITATQTIPSGSFTVLFSVVYSTVT